MVSRRAQIISVGISQEVSHTRTQSDCIHIYQSPKESFILSAKGVPGNSTFMGVLCELFELMGEVYTAVSPTGAPRTFTFGQKLHTLLFPNCGRNLVSSALWKYCISKLRN